MMKHLCKRYQFVYGFSQDEEFCLDQKKISVDEWNKLPDDIPTIEADWLIICIDPRIGFEKYTAKIKKICDNLTAQEFIGDICFFSSASICLFDHDSLSETTTIYPRTEIDLSLASGENLMTFLSCSENGYAVPHIMRIGVPYGDEVGMENLPCFVNHMVQDAQNKSPLLIPMCGEAKRSLTHVSDICESAIELMNVDDCPTLINIPGEVKTITDIGAAISNKYHVSFEERGLNRYNDQDYFAGDQHLSETLFNETVEFVLRYTFEQWLNEQRPERVCAAN
jgi:nucleoside-diphosphate-sugar epimerase